MHQDWAVDQMRSVNSAIRIGIWNMETVHMSCVWRSGFQRRWSLVELVHGRVHAGWRREEWVEWTCLVPGIECSSLSIIHHPSYPNLFPSEGVVREHSVSTIHTSEVQNASVVMGPCTYKNSYIAVWRIPTYLRRMGKR